MLLSLSRSCHHRDLHSFPTRRSSDLPHPALPLDAFFALHPSMPEFGRMYRDQQAAVIHAVATPYRERSHFDGQDVLESGFAGPRSEEHTSELQSLAYLVCRLLLEKKK